VLRASGDEDSMTSGRRRRPLSTALRASRDVIVDMSELRFADSSFIVDLAVLAQRLRAQGRTLSLRYPQPHVKRLIELVGLHRLPSVRLILPKPAGVQGSGVALASCRCS
jgi:anti-anti-sigma factor